MVLATISVVGIDEYAHDCNCIDTVPCLALIGLVVVEHVIACLVLHVRQSYDIVFIFVD